MPGIYQNLDFKNSLYNAIRLETFPLGLQYIYRKYIRNVGEVRGFYAHAGVLPPSVEPVWQWIIPEKTKQGEGGLRTNLFENPWDF